MPCRVQCFAEWFQDCRWYGCKCGCLDVEQPGLLLSRGWARAGTELLLQAEASGRLKEQHTFLYAMAADLRVLDIDKLLSQYKVRAAPCAASFAIRPKSKAHHRYPISWHA